MTVAGSGASIEVTRRNAPRLGDLLAGFIMNSKVDFDVGGGERAAIVKVHVWAQVEDVG